MNFETFLISDCFGDSLRLASHLEPPFDSFGNWCFHHQKSLFQWLPPVVRRFDLSYDFSVFSFDSVSFDLRFCSSLKVLIFFSYF